MLEADALCFFTPNFKSEKWWSLQQDTGNQMSFLVLVQTFYEVNLNELIYVFICHFLLVVFI